MPIDIAGYPHILDLILAHSSPASLASLRGVSRSLTTRVDALLFAHIALVFPSSSQSHGYISVRAVGTYVQLKWLRYGTGSKGRDPRRFRARKHVRRVVEAASCIDVDLQAWACAPAQAQAALVDAAVQLSPESTLRLFNASQSSQGIKFDALRGPIKQLVVFGATDWHGSADRVSQVLLLAPGALVSGRVQPRDSLACYNQHNLERVLHLLWADEPLDERPRREQQDPWISQSAPSAFLLRILEAGPFATPPSAVTVVGGGEEFRAVLGRDRKTPQEEFEDALDDFAATADCALEAVDAPESMLDDCSEMGWEPALDPMRAEIGARIAEQRRKYLSFVTPDQYALKVGAAQAALETQQGLSSRREPIYIP